MTATTPASSRWPDVFPRSACLLFLFSLATACGPAKPPKPAVSQAPPAAAPSAPASPTATNTTEVAATTGLPARAEANLPSAAPASNSSTEQPRVITWGSGPDSFGDTPDKDGYYSSRRHFDLDSKDKVRRALVLLEKDADGTLHLRFSKADIEEMPTVEEVLPRLENAPAESEGLLRNGDRLLPRFEVTTFEDHGEGTTSTVERRLTPPVSGYELRLNGDEINELLELQSVDLTTGQMLWNEPGIAGQPDRIEFFARDPMLFLYYNDFDTLGVFDIRKGLRCRYRTDTARLGTYCPWPSFVGDGKEIQFVEGETIWRVELSACKKWEVGRISLPPRPTSGIVTLAHSEASDDGSILLATVGQSDSLVRSPTGLNPVQVQYIWLEYEGAGYVEKRRVYTRAHNSIAGTESAVVESTRDPLLIVNQFRSRTLNRTTGALERQDGSAAVTFLLVRNGQGNFFALRAPSNPGVGVLVDSRRGLIHYGDKWFDLKVLARNLENDLLPPENPRAL